jgi:hypothetical protein
MPDTNLPPIMRTPGLRLDAILKHDGDTVLRFTTRNPGVEVVLIVAQRDVMYGYGITDPTTNTVTYYHGPHGDPERDTVNPNGVWGL